jgi:DNA transformation protein
MTRSAAGEEFVVAVTDMLAPLGSIHWSRFFSGHALKSADVQFAMVMKGTLYLRVDAKLAAELAAMGSRPFAYEAKRRRVSVDTYYSVPEDWLDDADALAGWAVRSIAAARASRKGQARRRR